MTVTENSQERIVAEQVVLIKQILASRFGLQVSKVETEPRTRNNFTHRVYLTSPLEKTCEVNASKAGTAPMPAGTTRVIIRIPNPDASVNHSVRIKNEVAAMVLARDALASHASHLIPDVYDWHLATDSSGWIIQEYMPGVCSGRTKLRNESKEHQHKMLSQMADVFKTLQAYQLPASVQGFGGLNFDDNGNVVVGPMAVEPYNGPFASMNDFYHGMLAAQLADCDRSLISDGWRRDGLRERIDKFVSTGFEKLLSKAPVSRPVLIMADFHSGNFLFDPETFQMTALIDLEWAHVNIPLHEYFFSFFDVHHLLEGPNVSSPPDIAIRTALLHGMPNPLPPSDAADAAFPACCGTETNLQWELMQMWDEQLERVGALRPKTIEGAEEISELYWFLTDLCHYYFLEKGWLAARSKAQNEETRKTQEEVLDKYLTGWGY